jgi:hypothetical protein
MSAEHNNNSWKQKMRLRSVGLMAREEKTYFIWAKDSNGKVCVCEYLL